MQSFGKRCVKNVKDLRNGSRLADKFRRPEISFDLGPSLSRVPTKLIGHPRRDCLRDFTVIRIVEVPGRAA
jgi:hypothetical protein